ncbi:MAG: nuclear transport factor 2 family protein [Candidatus Dormibacteraeota bacterium]|uniref:Nuclear transport factor 2 family protein n=1 Tax=Candidatus Dormiibacter inghamiae TaxID=3127013 RepID=A0A934KJV4_9BACT|nr:nuclear transport factor 2 family protein [Candidatus Dormibacteraeota bacterium]MBJ7606578.1 nuclear transport factor 2 family protein [Candidatus Dormibacteraeota bacterium]
MDSVVRAAWTAIDQRDWDTLKPLLHPYLHWTGQYGQAVRGRTKVLARLALTQPTEPPSDHELRDGQIYRWVESHWSS